jgi:error-prone DNA polymerase
MWTAAGSALTKGLLRGAPVANDKLQLPAPSEVDNIVADYQHLGLTLGAVLLALKWCCIGIAPMPEMQKMEDGKN